jgi:hypothetical protein
MLNKRQSSGTTPKTQYKFIKMSRATVHLLKFQSLTWFQLLTVEVVLKYIKGNYFYFDETRLENITQSHVDSPTIR